MVVAESPMCLEGNLQPSSHLYACSTEIVLIPVEIL